MPMAACSKAFWKRPSSASDGAAEARDFEDMAQKEGWKR
jgi:hypothetical protein